MNNHCPENNVPDLSANSRRKSDENGKAARASQSPQNRWSAYKKMLLVSYVPGRGGRKERSKEDPDRNARKKMLKYHAGTTSGAFRTLVGLLLLCACIVLTHLPFLGRRKGTGVYAAEQVPVQQAAIHVVLRGGVHQGCPVWEEIKFCSAGRHSGVKTHTQVKPRWRRWKQFLTLHAAASCCSVQVSNAGLCLSQKKLSATT